MFVEPKTTLPLEFRRTPPSPESAPDSVSMRLPLSVRTFEAATVTGAARVASFVESARPASFSTESPATLATLAEALMARLPPARRMLPLKVLVPPRVRVLFWTSRSPEPLSVWPMFWIPRSVAVLPAATETGTAMPW